MTLMWFVGIIERVSNALADSHDSQLSDRDQQLLDFEGEWWKYPGAKEETIREKFGMSSTRYYQQLNRLLDSREALAYSPMLVKRLRRMRSVRTNTRAHTR